MGSTESTVLSPHLLVQGSVLLAVDGCDYITAEVAAQSPAAATAAGSCCAISNLFFASQLFITA